MKSVTIGVLQTEDSIQLIRQHGDTFTSTAKKLNEELSDFFFKDDIPPLPVATVEEAAKEYFKKYGNRPQIDTEWCNEMFDAIKFGARWQATQSPVPDAVGQDAWEEIGKAFTGIVGNTQWLAAIEKLKSKYLITKK